MCFILNYDHDVVLNIFVLQITIFKIKRESIRLAIYAHFESFI